VLISTTGLSHSKLGLFSTVHQPCRLADHTALLVLHSDATSPIRCAHTLHKYEVFLPRVAMHSADCHAVFLSVCTPQSITIRYCDRTAERFRFLVEILGLSSCIIMTADKSRVFAKKTARCSVFLPILPTTSIVICFRF